MLVQSFNVPMAEFLLLGLLAAMYLSSGVLSLQVSYAFIQDKSYFVKSMGLFLIMFMVALAFILQEIMFDQEVADFIGYVFFDKSHGATNMLAYWVALFCSTL